MARNENTQKWIDALRSREYRQTRNRLHDTEGYCCLGVACDLFAKEMGDSKWVELPNDNGFAFRHNGEWFDMTSFLPRDVAIFFGLHPKYEDTLASMNDEGKTFSQIATRIEEDDSLFVGGY